MKISKKFVIVLGIAVLVTAGIVVWKFFFQPKFMYAGTIEATRIDLPSRVATVIAEIFVEEGQEVKKQQPLARLACEDLELAQSLAEENYRRAVKLQKTGAISKESFDVIANRKQEADIRLSWCELESPVTGTVITRFMEPKEWVNPGTKVFTLADLDNLWTYFYVPQEAMARLKVGAPVSGVIPALENRRYEGKIVKINDEAEFTPKNVQTRAERTRLVFGVKVEFKNPDRSLKPGMTIEAELPEDEG